MNPEYTRKWKCSFLLSNEGWVSFHHDFLLGVDMFLLPRINDVFLFQALKGERFRSITDMLHLYIVKNPSLLEQDKGNCFP